MPCSPIVKVIIFMAITCFLSSTIVIFWWKVFELDDAIRRWKPLKKLIHRYQRWKEWKKFCKYGKVKQILILLGIIKDRWFDTFVDWRNYTD